MACRGCANLQCNCFVKNSDSTITQGNGNQYAPFTFRPDYTPFPRPFGHLWGKTDQSLDGAPYTLFETTTPDVDWGGNMNTGNRTSLTASADGIYLVGATVPIASVQTDNLIDNISIRRNNIQISSGTWVNVASTPNPGLIVFMSTTTLQDLNSGDVIDLYIERVAGAGTVTVTTLTGSFGTDDFHPHLWAVWMAGGI